VLPRGRDALYKGLRQTPVDQWAVSSVVGLAHEIAAASDEFSLVALAARAADPVVLAATRESVALYAAVFGRALFASPIEYEWRVDPTLAGLANRFILTLNQFVLTPVPGAEPASAARFYAAFVKNDPHGRCVMIGKDDGGPSMRYYHWAIASSSPTDLSVEAFWHDAIWTTERYQTHGRPRPQVH